MRYSHNFPKTLKQAPKAAESVNHKLLVQAGFIDQLMSGSWTLLPLGFRVVTKINDIIREELDKTGAQEMLMPLLHPKEIWKETGRWDKARDIMYQLKKDDKEYGLSFTHEEIVMYLITKLYVSPKEFPIKIYHFSTKFRYEPRAKSGILRAREFLMKDLYSAHLTKDDMYKYYWEVAESYFKIFKRIGFDVKIVEAGGGVFTENITHEFQVLSDQGEDTIFYCDNCDFAQNKEIFKGKKGEICPKCRKGKMVEAKAIEVGNIFPLGTMYAEKMGGYYNDQSGQRKPVWLASYGIGPTRVLGTLVELFHDQKGIIWPKAVAPYLVHLISLGTDEQAEKVYRELQESGMEVLYDDRDVSAGEKFADADLIGIPYRLVVSQRSGGKIEFKERTASNSELLTLQELLKKIK